MGAQPSPAEPPGASPHGSLAPRALPTAVAGGVRPGCAPRDAAGRVICPGSSSQPPRVYITLPGWSRASGHAVAARRPQGAPGVLAWAPSLLPDPKAALTASPLPGPCLEGLEECELRQDEAAWPGLASSRRIIPRRMTAPASLPRQHLPGNMLARGVVAKLSPVLLAGWQRVRRHRSCPKRAEHGVWGSRCCVLGLLLRFGGTGMALGWGIGRDGVGEWDSASQGGRLR